MIGSSTGEDYTYKERPEGEANRPSSHEMTALRAYENYRDSRSSINTVLVQDSILLRFSSTSVPEGYYISISRAIVARR